MGLVGVLGCIISMLSWAWSLMVCYGLVLGIDVAGHFEYGYVAGLRVCL